MKNKIIHSILFILYCVSLNAAAENSIFSDPTREPKIFVNNRILVKVNGKPISTYDLMKKMDVSFYREYPQYASSTSARFQYYQMGWKHVLNEIIEKELILADAKESKITVSSGDLRQEMESSFGPNIIANLDKVGLSYDEAAKILEEEIIMKRMISGRVHAKALRIVTPIKIRNLYEDFAKDPANFRSTLWNYQVLTINDPELTNSEKIAKAAHQLLLTGVSIEDVSEKLKEGKYLSKKTKITLSEPIQNYQQELTENYTALIEPLNKGMFTEPFAQKSRAARRTVYKIIYIVNKTEGGIPTYKEMEIRLKNYLLDKVVDEETELYLEKLRKHYRFSQNEVDSQIPENYEPFSMQ